MTPQKRLLVALGLFVVALAAGFGLYYLFFRTPLVPTPEQGPDESGVSGGLPTAQPGQPSLPSGAQDIPTALPIASPIAQGGPTQTTALTDVPVKGATLSADGSSIIYYNETDGKFYRIAPDGTVILLSNQQFFDVDTITWSPDAKSAVLEYPDGANILFDFELGTQATLPKHWEEFEFSPTGGEIATKSIGVNSNNRWLITSKTDGSQAKIIAPLGENADKVTVSWSPSDEVVAFSATGSELGADTSEIYLIGKNDENFKSLIVEGRDFRPLWSPDGSQLLYSVYNENNGYRPTLWMSDARGDTIGANRRAIGLKTWADKCVFANAATVYCAVPKTIPEGIGMQPALRDRLSDEVYRLNITSGTTTFIGTPTDDSAMTNLVISADGASLFYTDIRTGILRKMRLK